MSAHWTFVFAAYALAGACLMAMVAVIAADHRALRRRLEDMERRGVARRGGPAP